MLCRATGTHMASVIHSCYDHDKMVAMVVGDFNPLNNIRQLGS